MLTAFLSHDLFFRYNFRQHCRFYCAAVFFQSSELRFQDTLPRDLLLTAHVRMKFNRLLSEFVT